MKRVRQSGVRVGKITRESKLRSGTDLASIAWDAQAGDHGRREHKSGRIQRECRSRTDQRDQPAHDCRSKDLNQPTGRPADRIGGKALLLGSEHRDNGLHGRVEAGVARGHPRGHEIGVPGALRPQQRQGEHRSNKSAPISTDLRLNRSMITPVIGPSTSTGTTSAATRPATAKH